jgi:hypothetical protein
MQSLPHAWSSPLVSVAARFGILLALGANSARAGEPSEDPAVDQPSLAVSSERRIILLVRTPGDEDSISRLRPELRDGGWHLLEIRPDPRLEMESLALTAERERVAAAVRVDAAHAAVELWVHRAQGSISETFTATGERSSGRVLAVRVAEALRARGLLLPPKANPSEAEAEPTAGSGTPARPAAPRAAAELRPVTPSDAAEPADEQPSQPTDEVGAAGGAERRATRLSVDVGAGLALSPGGLGPLAVLDLGLRLEIARVWSLAGLGLIPLSRQSVRGAEGEAFVSTYLVGGLLELEWARLGFGGFRSGLGAAATLAWMSGRPASGFRRNDELVSVLTPLARTSFHADLARWLRLKSALALGLTLPSVRVALDSREAASWGQPLVVASLAVELLSP